MKRCLAVLTHYCRVLLQASAQTRSIASEIEHLAQSTTGSEDIPPRHNRGSDVKMAEFSFGRPSTH